jgi:hypothetical protein
LNYDDPWLDEVEITATGYPLFSSLPTKKLECLLGNVPIGDGLTPLMLPAYGVIFFLFF